MKQSAETRIEKLEKAMDQNIEPPNIVLHFVRPSDRFTTGYMNLLTGETITQGDDEPDDVFTARAAAAGFGRGHAIGKS